MTGTQLQGYIGRIIKLEDARTQVVYRVAIKDARMTYGNLQFTVSTEYGAKWFTPSSSELRSIQ